VVPPTSPAVRLKTVGTAERDGNGWRTSWRIVNDDPLAVRVIEATAPHSQFRGATPLDLTVRAGDGATFALVVDIDRPPGSEIENAFVILLIRRGEERWRVLARVRVAVDGAGTPRPRVETMTAQRVGFSGEL
jgi:hypothetical protein